MSKIILMFLVLIISTGCYFFDHIGDNYVLRMHLEKVADGNRVFDGDPEPKFPQDPDATLEGVDSDKDGVRDDVEIYINDRFNTYNERMAWKVYAKKMQIFMMTGKEEDSMAVKQAFFCIDLMDGLRASGTPQVHQRSFNDFFLSASKRFQRYNQVIRELMRTDRDKVVDFDKMLALRFSVCEFEVQNKEELTKQINDFSGSVKTRFRTDKFVF